MTHQTVSNRRISGLCMILALAFGNALLANQQEKVEAPPFEGNILGMEIMADSLALVVDVSGSMRPCLPAIRMALKRQMPRNPTLHVDGCGIEKPRPQAQIENGVAPETVTAIDILGRHTTATTILWITDLADPPNVDGIKSLEQVLRERELQLLLISVKNGPPPSLQKVLQAREGYWKVVDAGELR